MDGVPPVGRDGAPSLHVLTALEGTKSGLVTWVSATVLVRHCALHRMGTSDVLNCFFFSKHGF